jgi:formate dehydrogenase subunit delta
MKTTGEKLVYMANQIGDFFKSYPQDQAVKGIKEHIEKFWDPRMRQLIYGDDHSALSQTAREAIQHLKAGGHPESQTRATKFNKVDEGGRSDAG